MGIPAGYKQYSLPTMGGEQKQLYDMLRSQFQGAAPDLFSQLRGMASGQPNQAIEGQIQRKYQEDIIPQLGAAYGMSGTQKSSGFQGQVARQGRNLAEDLAAQRGKMQKEAIESLMGLGKSLLGTGTEKFGLQKESGGLDIMQLLEPGGEALGSILKDIIGKPGMDQPSGSEGIDWGNIASTAAKFLPTLLALL